MTQSDNAKLVEREGFDLGSGGLEPATPLQAGMLSHWLREGRESGIDLEQMVISLPEPVDAARVRDAWNSVARHHEVLRGFFAWGEGAPHFLTASAVEIPFEFLRCPATGAARDREVADFLEADRAEGFDLAQPPLMRLTLIEFGPADFQLVWTFHHALLDGRSMPAILRDAFALYADPDAALPSPARGFGDFARWMVDQDFSGSDAFWAEQLGGFTAPTPIAIDSLGPDRGESDAVFRGEREISLSPTLTSLLDRIAKANGWTMNTILQGAWGIVLARYAGADDVVFGATRACRKSALGGDPAAAEIVGLLINTVPVRAKAGGCTKIADYLTALRGQWLAMRPHEHTPLSRAQAQSGVALDRPLFDTLVVYENGDLNDAMRALGGGAWDARAVQLYERTNFPITLAGYGGRRLRLKIEFDRARLSGAAIERMLGHLETILRGIAANPGNKIKSLDLLTDRERQGLPAPSAERRFESPLTLHAQFEQRVAESPDAVAATCGADRLTYAALNRRANQLAKALVDLGVKPGDFVGLCVERSLNVPASVLGILKAGAAYLPVDLAYPQDRLAFMLEDANAPILVTQRSLADQLPAHRARLLFLDDLPEAGDACDANIDGGAAADDLAYCIYTSGSTGRPKGVMVTHQNVNRLMRATDAWFGFGAGDVWTLFHSYAFDFSVWEIWGALLYGGRLVVVPYLVSREPRAFYELVAEEGVTVLNQTPSAFRQFIKAEEDGARELALRYVIFGGEALEMRSLQPWFDRHGDAEPQLVNMYGITETTVHVTYRPLRQSDLAGGSVIGIPIPDLQIYILDPHGNPLPEGVPGEMFVGGAGLARGYLNRPELTAERFIKHPFAGGEGERLYRTGDVARLLPGGDLEYLGRCDDQVKIRGFRIELGEIESVLCEHPAIREACVIAREDAPGEKRLAAYYVAAAAGAEPSVAGLREHLLHKLPDYMVPAAFVAMPDFPLTENGKINRRALPAPGSDRADLGREFAAPRTDAEMALAAIWAEVLRVDRIGIHDKFFELGGDSILLIQIVSKARAKGIPISARDVFQKQTIAELAKGEAPGAEPQPVTVAKAQPLDVPLTPIQQWFFEQNFPEPHFYNQAFLFDVAEPLDTALLQGALDAVADHHPIFRARFEKRDDQWRAIYANGLPIADVPLSIIPLPSDPAEFEHICAAEQSRFDLNSGNLLHATYFEPADDSAGGKLFLAAHHLAIDGVTWAIMLQDLEAAYRGEPLPSRTDTVARWAQALQRYAAEPQTAAQVPYWQSVTRGAPSLAPDPANTEGAAKTLTFALDAAETETLLRAVPAALDARPHEAMIGALAGALREFFGDQPAVIETEGHGREGIIDSDISRTAGWFTSIFPLRLDGIGGAPADAAQRAAQLIRAVPDNGIGYGVLRYLEKSLDAAQPRVLFNFLGQFDQVLAGSRLFAFAPERSGAWHGPSNRRRHELEINTMIRGGQLRIEWTFCPNLWDDADASRAAESFAANLREIIAASRATPATSEPETYALAPLQELYFTLESARPNAGFDQWHFRLRGNVDAAALEKAWRHTIARHPILRTTFAEEAGAPVQSVQPDAALTWQQRDWRGESDPGARFAAFLREDAAEGFSLADGPLTRITLIQLGEADYRFVWSHHHLQIDGWSWPLILRDVRAAYGAILRGDSPALPPAIPYRCFIDWLESRDDSASVTYWKSELDGFAEPTPLPGAPSASNAFAEIDAALTEEESRSLAAAARTLGVTPNALAQLAWAAVLAKMSGSNDVVFGASFSGRPADLEGVGEIVGPFVNNLPVRVELNSAQPLADIAADHQGNLFDLSEHQFLHPIAIQECSAVPLRQRLFESLLVFQNYEVGEERESLGAAAIGEFTAPIRTNLPLTLVAEPRDAFRAKAIYQAARFAESEARAMLGAWLAALRFIAANSSATAADLLAALRVPAASASAASEAPASARPYAAPRTATEKQVAAIWRAAFGIERLSADDNFFDLGGHSLLMVHVHAKLRKALRRDLPLVTAFRYPTIAGLARHLDGDAEALVAADAPEPNAAAGGGIAIVGMVGRFPGAESIDELWENLCAGRETIATFTAEELRAAGIDPAQDGTDYVPRRGVLTKPEFFDAAFFGITPREAEAMDPQQRIFLEACWEALESAGYTPSTCAGDIGVYAGMSNNTYFANNVQGNPALRAAIGELATMMANEKDYLATRTAYKLNLTGPALNVYTACSTSLVAVCHAVESLLAGRCDLALAGGVSATFPHARGYAYEPGGILSPDGHCRPFDEAAGGTVFSNGYGVVALKRLEDAERDGDPIHAVIRGIGINNDGSDKVSFTAPSVGGQAKAIRMAQQMAGFSPESIGYVEAHGTGTALGDPIEVAALTEAFRAGTDRVGFCTLGALKSNIGHLDAAAGIAGLIKATLAVERGEIPGTLHFRRPNPKLGLAQSPFVVTPETRRWDTGSAPRRAGISSFGVGGTNAHVVLEQAPPRAETVPSTKPMPVVLSARSEAALDAAASRLADFLAANPHTSLADAAFTLACGRDAFEHRLAIAAVSPEDAGGQLRDGTGRRAARAKADRANAPVAFLFPGQGSQSAAMGAALYQSDREFRDAFDACRDCLAPHLGGDLRAMIDEGSALDEARIAQAALFATEFALAKLWMARGVEPAALIGHSLGEYTAACLAGVMSLEDAARLVAVRARLVQDQPGGAMLAVRLPECELRTLLPEGAEIAALNAEKLTVAAGPPDAIEALEARLKAERIVSKRLRSSHAFHSAMVAPAMEPFRRELARVALHEPAIPVISNVTGDWATAEVADPDYWVRHLREPVRFLQGIAHVLADGYALLECGPGNALASLARQHPARDKSLPVVESGTDEGSAVSALGKLWAGGARIDWAKFFAAAPRRRIALPTYPFERKRFWSVPTEAALPTTNVVAPADAIAGSSPVEAEEPAAPVDRRAVILADVRAQLAALSGIAENEIAEGAAFLELGFDSLFLTQSALTLTKHFGVKITFGQLMGDLGTAGALADFLEAKLPADRYAAKPSAAPASKSKAPAAAAAGSVEARLSAVEQTLANLVGGKPAPGAKQASAARPAIKVSNQHAADQISFGPFKPIQTSKDGGLTGAQESHLRDLVAQYTARTPGSKSYTDMARRQLADPRAVAGFNPLWKEMVYPVVCDRSEGGFIWDVDGNRYVDVTLGFGLSLFGHRPKFVTDAVAAQLDRGIEIGPSCPLAAEVAALMCEFSGMDRVSFCNTGSEAVTAALRVSRTVSGRNLIAVFEGAYHGIFDEVLVRPLRANGELRSMPIAPGIAPSMVENVIVLEYGNPESLDILRAHGDDIAAVLVEPVQSRRPALQPREFMHGLRQVTEDCGIALVFDEVVTGFRTCPGGAQEFFGVRADIATYGKVVGGGLPIGVVAGKAKYLDALDGGPWQYGDDSFPEVGVTFFAGTFVRHPLALAAAKAVLEHIKAEGPALQESLNARTEAMVAELNAFCERAGVPLKLSRFASMYFIHAAPELKYASLLFYHMRARGIHIWETRPSFLCTAHTDDDVAAIKQAFEESVRALQVGGFFPGGSGLPTAPPSEQTEDEPASFPLTEMQEELFLVSKMSEDGSRACNESIRIRLRGALDHAALERALGALVARHEALRTRFAADGECQIVAPALPVSLPVVDCGEDGAEPRRRAIGSASFDLENGPLFRAELLRFGQSDHELLLAAHHTICDGFSFDLLAGELAALYRGGSALPPAIPYRAFADWHRAQQETEDFGDSAAYWMDRFADVPEPIRWPSDRPRPAQRSFRAATADAHISPDLAEKVRGFAKANACTPFNVMLAAYAALLHRLTGQDDLVIGIPSAGQPAMGAASLCGHCVNFLPIRVDAGGARSGSDLAKALRGDLANAFDHQAVTLGSLIKRLAIKRDARQPALVSTTFSLEQGVGALDFGSGVRGEAAGNPKEFFGFDLSLFLVEEGGGFRIHTIFNRDLFDAATIGRWLGYYVGMLGAIAAQGGAAIGDLAMMPEAERHLVLRKWNATRVPYPRDKAAHQLFEERAAQHPDSVALMGEGGEVTYAALNARANQIAHALIERGIGGGDRVGIFLERGPDLIAAMFGVLKAGAAYVPVDPCYPAERIAFMLADTGARATLTQSSLADRLPPEAEAMLAAEAAGRAENPNIATSSADVAYIIYTSGSTGQPKGVPVPHRGIVRLVKGANYCDFSRSQVFLQAATVCFDASVFEIYGPLLNGARLALLPPGSPSLETLGEAIRRHGVTTLWLTSGLFQMMVEERIADLRGLKQLLAGGDALSVPHVRKALRELDGTVLINGYGPTENTTFTCCHRITEADAESASIPIGRPISNTTAYILDRRGNPEPPGIPGELCTGGDGLARDYLNNPELSAERYAADPFSAEPGARLYRTGDLCRHLPDGTIEFLGRIDHQLKIRGFRVEPGEIESALYANPAVGRCKVVAKGVDAGSKFLVGYASPANGVPVTPESLREHLRHRLPDYMVPSSFVILPSLPLTPNGKIDTRALPEPERAAARDGSATRDGSAEAPATAAERCLARLWEDTLGAEGIGRDEDFFALGGHSLLGLRLFTRIEREFGQALPLATLFQAPTVRKLAALLESAAEGGDVPNILIPVQPDGSGDPLFCVHGGDGGILFYKTLADRLGNDRPFFAVEAPTLTSDAPIPEERVEETAARYVEELLRFRPRGPFLLGGYSFGGLVAYEMAQQLRQAGHDVPFLGLFDTENPAAEVRPYSLMERAAVRWSAQEGDNFFAKVGALSRRAGEGLMNKLRYSTQAAAAAAAAPAKGGSKLRHIQLREAHARAMECYAPQPYAGRVTLFKAAAINDKFEVPDDYGWGDLAGGGLDIIEIPGAHLTIFEEDNAPELAAAVRRALGGIDASAALASNAAAAALSVPL